MKSLRDEIRLAAGDMDGFNFIQAFGLDFICTADFILASARISFKMPNQVLFPGWAFCIFRTISHYKSLDLWGYRWNCRVIVRLMCLSLDLWVIVRIVGNR